MYHNPNKSLYPSFFSSSKATGIRTIHLSFSYSDLPLPLDLSLETLFENRKAKPAKKALTADAPALTRTAASLKNCNVIHLNWIIPVPSPLSLYEGGRVADLPCGKLRSATQTGYKSVSQKRKNYKQTSVSHTGSMVKRTSRPSSTRKISNSSSQPKD